MAKQQQAITCLLQFQTSRSIVTLCTTTQAAPFGLRCLLGTYVCWIYHKTTRTAFSVHYSEGMYRRRIQSPRKNMVSSSFQPLNAKVSLKNWVLKVRHSDKQQCTSSNRKWTYNVWNSVMTLDNSTCIQGTVILPPNDDLQVQNDR